MSRKSQRRNTIDERQSRKYMTIEEEDILIAEILPKFDIIEKKSTDKSLNAKKLIETQNKVWAGICASFNGKVEVCKSH